MGNKPSLEDERILGHTARGKNLRTSFSDESYVPMSASLRRSLVEGKRFRHVVPSREPDIGSPRTKTRTGENEAIEEKGETESIALVEDKKEKANSSDEDLNDKRAKEREELSKFTTTQGILTPKFQIEPIVTVMNTTEAQTKSDCFVGLNREKDIDNENQIVKGENRKAFPKSPDLSNRRYSLIDMRTGLKKSKFTLELEEKLRQSKLDLGFDNDLNDLKELCYKIDESESKNKGETLRKVNLRLGLEGNVGKGLEMVQLKEPLQYCAQNCQILGLCSIRQPGLLPKSLGPTVLADEISQNHDIDNILNHMDKVKHHHKKDDCNCQICMLAFLTEMGFPEEENTQLDTIQENRSPRSSHRGSRRNSGDRRTERLRIIENGRRYESIEVSYEKGASNASSCIDVNDGVSSKTSTSTRSFSEDCTNERIKRMFRKNNFTVEEIYTSQNKTRPVQSVERRLSSAERITRLFDKSQETNQVLRAEEKKELDSNGVKHFPISTTTSTSSSLSSIMSYKRVRRIFQTFIERNRSRRRPRKNINKFKEMEELGLGHFMNNRWYPSDSKTASIWNGFYQSVQGIQAEFKKYPRTPLKSTE